MQTTQTTQTTQLVSRREMLRRSLLTAAGLTLVPALATIDPERIGWRRRFFPGWSAPAAPDPLAQVVTARPYLAIERAVWGLGDIPRAELARWEEVSRHELVAGMPAGRGVIHAHMADEPLEFVPDQSGFYRAQLVFPDGLGGMGEHRATVELSGTRYTDDVVALMSGQELRIEALTISLQ